MQIRKNINFRLCGANTVIMMLQVYIVSATLQNMLKFNMPLGTTFQNPQLTDEEAWDIAGFVNSRPRPHINFPRDWPDNTKKPVDHPFGPYADNFSIQQHKYGPFKPIEDEQKKRDAEAVPVKEKVISK